MDKLHNLVTSLHLIHYGGKRAR